MVAGDAYGRRFGLDYRVACAPRNDRGCIDVRVHGGRCLWSGTVPLDCRVACAPRNDKCFLFVLRTGYFTRELRQTYGLAI
jgi:hypothetical protein